MTDEKKKKSQATGERLNQQVLMCIHNHLSRLPDAKTRQRLLEYVMKGVGDEAQLERANELARRPFDVNGKPPKQERLFAEFDE